MRVLMTGSTGLIGSALVPYLEQHGHTVVRAVRPGGRQVPGFPSIEWDPEADSLNPADFEDFDAVVHLAGENLGGGRWTDARKRTLVESRTHGTRALAAALASLRQPPKVLVSASAIGFYGDRADERLTEASLPGSGFLADLVKAWEAAADPARAAGIRVVHPRFAMVLSAEGGALEKLLLPFRLGLGTRFGSGRQWWSWIALEDVPGAVAHLLAHPELEGPVNVAAPETTRNRDFARVLGRILSRPAFLVVPAFALRLLMGEMADEMLLGSARVEPVKLAGSGYVFRHADLEGALRNLLARG